MGTRHLIAVARHGEYKIAQYGQWDGYPSGQGTDVLEFAVKLTHRETRIKFERALEKVRWADKDYLNQEQKTYEKTNVLRPELNRGTGAEILNLVMEGKATQLFDQLSFASDGLFCEYAYVLDLDEDRLEAYVGFQKMKHSDGRFADMSPESGLEHRKTYYAPVRLAASWPLRNLPSAEEFESTIRAVETGYRHDRYRAEGVSLDAEERAEVVLGGPVIR